MRFIGVEVGQETSAPPPEKNPGSAPVSDHSTEGGRSRESNYRLGYHSRTGRNTYTFLKRIRCI